MTSGIGLNDQIAAATSLGPRKPTSRREARTMASTETAEEEGSTRGGGGDCVTERRRGESVRDQARRSSTAVDVNE